MFETIDIKTLMTHNIQVHSPKFNGNFSDETQELGSTYNCDQCSFSTTVQKEYTSHVAESHSFSADQQSHQCQLCGKILGRKDSLKSHMNSVHKRPYNCPSCPYETAQESRLTRYFLFSWLMLHHLKHRKLEWQYSNKLLI